ncbi:hypothetical protein Q5752_004742 [Cryptotrichosporon argae]
MRTYVQQLPPSYPESFTSSSDDSDDPVMAGALPPVAASRQPTAFEVRSGSSDGEDTIEVTFRWNWAPVTVVFPTASTEPAHVHAFLFSVGAPGVGDEPWDEDARGTYFSMLHPGRNSAPTIICTSTPNGPVYEFASRDAFLESGGDCVQQDNSMARAWSSE